MATTEYRVKSGDTLSAIARRYKVTVEELARANSLSVSDVNRIWPGQVLKVPETAPPPSRPAQATSYRVNANDRLPELSQRFNTPLDALMRANGMNEGDRIVVGQLLRIPPAAPVQTQASPTPTSFPPGPGTLQPQKSPPGTPPAGEAGHVTLNNKGKEAPPPGPVKSTIKDEDNLELGPNEGYREALLAAFRRTTLPPQTLAAIINAEAAHEKTQHWKADSRAGTTTATGLGQFLAQTWLGLACQKGTSLNQYAQDHRLVKPIYNKKTQKITGWEVAGSEEKQTLLDLRVNPEMNAMVVAETATSHLARLQTIFTVPASVTRSDLARIAYLYHHEGAGGAEKFLHQKDSHTQETLEKQVGKQKASTYLKANHDDATLAYRAWLGDYIDSKINPLDFARDKRQFPTPRPLRDIIADLSPASGKPSAPPPPKHPSSPPSTSGAVAAHDKSGLDFQALARNVYDAMFNNFSLLGVRLTDEDKVYNNLARLNHDEKLITPFKQAYKKLYGAEVERHIEHEFSDTLLFGDELTRALSYLRPKGSPPPKAPGNTPQPVPGTGTSIDSKNQLLVTLATGTLKSGKDGTCVTTVRTNMQALGVPTYGSTGADPNNSRAAMVQMLKSGKWESLPLPGSELRTIQSAKAYGSADAYVCPGRQILKLAEAKQIPLGAIIFQTMYGWDYSGGATGNDIGIVRDHDNRLTTFNYKQMSNLLVHESAKKKKNITHDDEVVLLVPKGAVLRN